MLSQPMPAYPLQCLFPPSDKFPSLSSNISLQDSFNTNPAYSPRKLINQESQSFPMTPNQVLKHFSDKLTKWEINEISVYNTIYCIGSEAEKIKTNQNSKTNFNFDDDKGKYKVVIKDHIAYRYEICEIYGNGTFGVVIKALDLKENKYVALKIIDRKNNIGNEVDILRYIKSKDEKGLYGIVDFLGSFTFRDHIVIIFEVLSINLFEFLKNSHFEGISLNLIRRIASQIIQALCFLHGNRIIHCDLKPENVLFKELNRSLVKLVDFGTSCFEDRKIFTYIQSRYYRAPEIILGLEYTSAIDIWSLGCILAELYIGRPIFQGESDSDQLYCIMEYCGYPPTELILQSHKWRTYFDDSLHVKNIKKNRENFRKPGGRTIEGFLRNADVKFVEFVKMCLEIDPRKRITAQEALLDQWIMDFSMKVVPKKEPVKRKLSLTMLR
ncbi:hypothetical protein SteCoe_9965 [Stentor coeruleus]|uniref:dual-specificity kinase n=1 Tax=Stentor coeruleus TaxID=5963 RepID=A0A1R2CGL2_9CILI|nr:hypothetical protein SteCoe_9965 [Stentor coeruleus]